MTNPKKPISSAIAKAGVNYTEKIVESCNSIFHRIPQENDFGNDAFIELVDGEEVKGITIAVQIKSGRSFCTKTQCRIPASRSKFLYWQHHSLKVIGVVYDPLERTAYWVDISWFLEKNPDVIEKGPFLISFDKTEVNRFTASNFKNIFLPLFLGKRIYLPEKKAICFAQSEDFDLHYMGISALMSHYRNNLTTWDLFFKILHEREVSSTSDALVYFFAHVPGHPDIFWHEHNILENEIRREVKSRLKKAGRDFIKKLLQFMDEEDDWERGSLGQNIEAIVSIIDEKEAKLLEIGLDSRNSTLVRESSGYLLAYYKQDKALGDLKKICASPGMSNSFLLEVSKMIKEEGYFYFY